MKRAVCLILIQLLAAIPGRGQYFHHIGIKEGLSQLYVKSIYQDDLGRMWFGTNSGIDLYDGNSISALDLSDCTAQNSEVFYNKNTVGEIVGDRYGNIYFIIGRRLVQYRLRTGTFRICSETAVSGIHSHEGEVYLWGENGLYRWDSEHDALLLVNRISLDRVNDFVIDRSGAVWITAYHRLYRMSAIDAPPILHAAAESLSTLYETSGGALWIASAKNGIYTLDASGSLVNYNKTNSSDIGLHCDFIRDIAEDRAGNLWFGTFDGLYKYDLAANRFSAYRQSNTPGSLANSSIYSLFCDKRGYIWIGTYYGGVNYFDPDFGINYFPANQGNNGLSHPVIGNMAEDRRGVIWICTEGGGLNSYDPKTRRIRHFRSATSEFLPATNLKAIAYDSLRDELYIATYPLGLYVYDIRRDRFRALLRSSSPRAGAPTELIHSLQIHDGYLYIGATNGVFRMHPDSARIRPILSGRYVAFSRIDRRGDLWTVDNRVIRRYPLHDLKSYREYRLDITSNLLYLTSIYDDRKGRIYALTAGRGLFVMNERTQEFERFPTNDTSLSEDYCYKLADTGHNLVVSGSKGLVVLDREGKIAKIYPSDIEPFSSYVYDCGLFVSSEGLLYAGGTNGLVTLNPAGIDKRAYGKIYFSKLSLGNETIEPGDRHRILEKPLPQLRRKALPVPHVRVELHTTFYALKCIWKIGARLKETLHLLIFVAYAEDL